MREKHQVAADRIEPKTAAEAAFRDADQLGLLEETIDFCIDVPGRPAGIDDPQIGPNRVGIGRPQKGIVARATAETEQLVDLEDEFLIRKRLPAGADHALGGLQAGGTAGLIIERLEQPPENLKQRAVLI